MSKPESDINRWDGKSTEDVFAESFHELRVSINSIRGYLDLFQTLDWPVEQKQKFIDLALDYAISARDVMRSVEEHMNWKREDR